MTLCTIDYSEETTELILEAGSLGKSAIKFKQVPEKPVPHYLYSERSDDINSGWFIVRPKKAINLVKNPIFYNDLDFYFHFNARAYRTTNNSFEGGASLRLGGNGDSVTDERRIYSETEIEGYIPGRSYTFSAFGWLPQEYDNKDIMLGTVSIVQITTTGVISESLSERICNFGCWERVAATTRIKEDVEKVYARVNFRYQQSQAPNACPNDDSEFMYWDMLQFEEGSCATLPFHGDWDIYGMDKQKKSFYWADIPHRSCSFRGHNARGSGELVPFNQYGLQVISHGGHDAPQLEYTNLNHSRIQGSHKKNVRANNRTLTFSIDECKMSLKDLECCLMTAQTNTVPDMSNHTQGKFLLVYIGEDYFEDRVIAFVVNYVSGYDYTRESLFSQRFVLQFEASAPVFAFRYPGQDAKRLDYATVGGGNKLLVLNDKGFATNTDILPTTILHKVLMLGENKFLLGGNYLNISTGIESHNFSYYDCNGFVNNLMTNGQVLDMALSNVDSQVIVGGSFTFPYTNLFIFDFSDNTYEEISGYVGGTVTNIAIPFWGEVIVSDVNHDLYIKDDDEIWTVFNFNGSIEDIHVTNKGNVYVVGNFTDVEGIEVSNFAKLVYTNNCFTQDFQWERVNFTFDDELSTITGIDNLLYIGGKAVTALPDSIDICHEVNREGQRVSNGSDQQVIYTDLGAGVVRIELRFLNVDCKDFLNFSLKTSSLNPAFSERGVRILLKNGFGHQDEWYLLDYNTTVNDLGWDGTHHVYQIDIDTTVAVPGGIANCEIVNENLYGNFLTTNPALVVLRSTQDLDNQSTAGEDTTVSNITVIFAHINYKSIETALNINKVFSYDGRNINLLGDGLSEDVNDLEINSHMRNNLYAATEVDSNGKSLFIWDGFSWQNFAGKINGDGALVKDIDISFNGEIGIATDSNGLSTLPGNNILEYAGNFEQYDLDFVLRGEGNLLYLRQYWEGINTISNFCTFIEGNSLKLSLPEGTIRGRGINQTSTIYNNSDLNYWLMKSFQYFNTLVLSPDSKTEVIILWREAFWGINAYSCLKKALDDTKCQVNSMIQIRPPDECDDSDRGWTPGDLFVDASEKCFRFFIYSEDEF